MGVVQDQWQIKLKYTVSCLGVSLFNYKLHLTNRGCERVKIRQRINSTTHYFEETDMPFEHESQLQKKRLIVLRNIFPSNVVKLHKSGTIISFIDYFVHIFHLGYINISTLARVGMKTRLLH